MAWVLVNHRRVYWNRGPWFIFETLEERDQKSVLMKLDLLDQNGLKSEGLEITKIGESHSSGDIIFSLKVNSRKRVLFSFVKKEQAFYILDIVNADAMKIFRSGYNG